MIRSNRASPRRGFRLAPGRGQLAAVGIRQDRLPVGRLGQPCADPLSTQTAWKVGHHADLGGVEAAAMQEDVVEPGLALRTPEEHVGPDLPDRLLGPVDLCRVLPVVGTASPIGGLAPPRRSVFVDDVQEQAVVAPAADVLGLAPSSDDNRPLVRPFVADDLGDAHPVLIARRLAPDRMPAGVDLPRLQHVTPAVGRPRRQPVRIRLLQVRVGQFVGRCEGREQQAHGYDKNQSVANHDRTSADAPRSIGDAERAGSLVDDARRHRSATH